MKLTNSQEEYLKTIYILENSNKKIRVTDIAKKLNITKPSVNRAIKMLKEINLIEYEAYGDILLTNEGKQYAKEILKKKAICKRNSKKARYSKNIFNRHIRSKRRSSRRRSKINEISNIKRNK